MTTAAQLRREGVENATITAVIKALRGSRPTDDAALAAHLGMSRATLFKRLNQTSPWLAFEVARAAEYFVASVDDIYKGIARVNIPAQVSAPPAPVEAPLTVRYLGGNPRTVTELPLGGAFPSPRKPHDDDPEYGGERRAA